MVRLQATKKSRGVYYHYNEHTLPNMCTEHSYRLTDTTRVIVRTCHGYFMTATKQGKGTFPNTIQYLTFLQRNAMLHSIELTPIISMLFQTFQTLLYNLFKRFKLLACLPFRCVACMYYVVLRSNTNLKPRHTLVSLARPLPPLHFLQNDVSL